MAHWHRDFELLNWTFFLFRLAPEADEVFPHQSTGGPDDAISSGPDDAFMLTWNSHYLKIMWEFYSITWKFQSEGVMDVVNFVWKKFFSWLVR